MRTDVDSFLVETLGAADSPAGDTAFLDALVAVGLMDAQDATRWRKALESGVPPQSGGGALPDPGLTARVSAYLGALVDGLAPEAEGPAVERASERRELLALIGVFHDLGLVESAQYGRFTQVVQTELMSRMVVRTPSVNVRAELARLNRERALGDVHNVHVGPPVRRRGLRILCIEVYGAAVVVRWHRVKRGVDYGGPNPAPADELEPQSTSTGEPLSLLRLEDDLGTSYRRCRGSALPWTTDRGDAVSLGDCTFEPAAPRSVRRLRVAIEHTVFDVSAA